MQLLLMHDLIWCMLGVALVYTADVRGNCTADRHGAQYECSCETVVPFRRVHTVAQAGCCYSYRMARSIP